MIWPIETPSLIEALQTAATTHEQARHSLQQREANQQRTRQALETLKIPETIRNIRQHQHRLQQVQTQQQAEGIQSQDAGLVLIWPYLKTLFGNLDLLTEDTENGTQFVDETAQIKAHALLVNMLAADPTTDIWSVANVMVGLPLDTLVSTPIIITRDEIKQSERLLKAVIQH